MMMRMQAPVSEPAMMTGSLCSEGDVWLAVVVISPTSYTWVTIDVLSASSGVCSSAGGAGSDAVKKTQTHCGYHMDNSWSTVSFHSL